MMGLVIVFLVALSITGLSLFWGILKKIKIIYYIWWNDFSRSNILPDRMGLGFFYCLWLYCMSDFIFRENEGIKKTFISLIRHVSWISVLEWLLNSKVFIKDGGAS